MTRLSRIFNILGGKEMTKSIMEYSSCQSLYTFTIKEFFGGKNLLKLEVSNIYKNMSNKGIAIIGMRSILIMVG